jgi:hypothetical protein
MQPSRLYRLIIKSHVTDAIGSANIVAPLRLFDESLDVHETQGSITVWFQVLMVIYGGILRRVVS